jgi:propanediol dehydratase small subunit
MSNDDVCTISGRMVSELSMEDVLAGELTVEDFRISAETLRCQADNAESAGYRQLAENLRRAAELTRIPNQQVLEIYDSLRPGRTSQSQLMAWADRLEAEYGAPLTAALVREAADVYLERGVLKPQKKDHWR